MSLIDRARVALAATICTVALGSAACRKADFPSPAEADHSALADTLTQLVDTAWDFSKGDVVDHLMSLYPQTGPVYSAAGGRVTTSRDSLRTQIETFWRFVGQNMRNPRFERIFTHVDVLAPDAAVLTTTYHIPHIQPNGMAHDLGGAMTLVFRRRNGRWSVIAEHLSDAPR
ncbi:MAG: DUF4440 domain-containing protein [Gemmatimonadota bacterium]|nr:DUF4440 domain-containing protein [Gemmatimonadota bacterium]